MYICDQGYCLDLFLTHIGIFDISKCLPRSSVLTKKIVADSFYTYMCM